MRKKIVVLGIIIIFIGSVYGFTQESQSDQEKKIDELIKTLGTKYWEKAFEALVEIGEPAVEPLIKAMKDTSGFRLMSSRATYTLGKRG